MKPILLACLLLTGCARKYQVCFTSEITFCGTPMPKHDAELAVKYGNRPEPHAPYVVMRSDGVTGLHYREEKP